MKGPLQLTAIVLLMLLFPGYGVAAEQSPVLRISDGKVISHAEMIAEIRGEDIIFSGEIHNNPHHHRLQLETIIALTDAGVPVAVGFEMFPKEEQAALDRWTDGSMSLEEFKTFYQKHWTLPWTLYEDIFSFIREKRLPAIALNIPSDIVQTVSKSGFLSLTDEQLKRLPPGLGCNVDEQYREFIRRVYMLHKMKGKEFTYFCEKQLLWDKSMAWYLLEYRGKHPQRVVVVIAGLSHAWKNGIPAQVRQYSPTIRYVVLLPEVPGLLERGKTTREDSDYIGLK